MFFQMNSGPEKMAYQRCVACLLMYTYLKHSSHTDSLPSSISSCHPHNTKPCSVGGILEPWQKPWPVVQSQGFTALASGRHEVYLQINTGDTHRNKWLTPHRNLLSLWSLCALTHISEERTERFLSIGGDYHVAAGGFKLILIMAG